ncbi:MAG: hypothetical protein COV67_04510 [Nitrospinae bacterium CG11_big_fil_rev_8_21_14_0_20_56_8]|nr:MAG: hypothetical protein COV67_04510 [Nitrospinae bacterium CG11_big_fil_rev_8_21_14_0_20_56_8]
MRSLATITVKDIETIKMALNDAISDMNTELKGGVSEKQRQSIFEFKGKYSRVFENLKQNPSIYALSEAELDVVAGGLNDAVQLIEENITDDLTDQEKSEIMLYKNDCLRLVEILAG